MVKTCRECSKSTSNYEQLNFTHTFEGNLFEVKINRTVSSFFPDYFTYCHDCIKKIWQEKFEHSLAYKVLKIDNSRIVIDWNLHESLLGRLYYRSRTDVEEDFFEILTTLQVLSPVLENVWVFSEKEMNPKFRFNRMSYFIKKEDAISYAKTKWANVFLDYRLYLIKEMITKQELQ